MKSYFAKQGEIDAKWYVVDLTDKVLGRAAVRIATILMGKHRPQYTPHVDTGEFVVAINASKLKLTGNTKQTERVFAFYTRYPGGYKEIPLGEMFEKDPAYVLREAVRRMLPKSKLGKNMIDKLKVYSGSEHPHQAQQPQALEL